MIIFFSFMTLHGIFPVDYKDYHYLFNLFKALIPHTKIVLAFWIPTCWYQQCDSLMLGVLPNAKPQHEGVPVAQNWLFELSILTYMFSNYLILLAHMQRLTKRTHLNIQRLKPIDIFNSFDTWHANYATRHWSILVTW